MIVHTMLWLAILLSSLSSAPTAVQGFSFSLTSEPTQCANLSISWSGGTPPYEVTIVPMYYTGLDSPVWDWSVVDENTTETSWSGMLAMPGGSFIAIVLSDDTGFGSGGTSTVLTVANSSDSSCQPTSKAETSFSFALNPPDGVGQCDTLEFLIGGYNITFQPSIAAIVPGGPSLVLGIPELAVWYKGISAYYLNWTVDMPAGMDVVFVAGDETGRAAGGFLNALSVANSSSTECLTNSPFIVTTSSTSSSSSSPSHTSAIVGGLVGGVAGLALLIFLAMTFIRRRNIRARRRSTQEKAVGLRMYPLEGFNRDETTREAFGTE